MAKLSFNFDGQTYVSDVFSGGKVVQLSFPIERTKVLLLETRLSSTLPWDIVDSRIIERHFVVSVPDGGEGQEFRMTCIAEPSSADISTVTPEGGGAIKPGETIPENTVDSAAIQDGTIQMEDLDPNIVTTPEEARRMVADAIAGGE